MRSRANLRGVAEWVARAALIVLLAAALWRAVRTREGGGETRVTSARTLAPALRTVAEQPEISALHVRVDAPVSRASREWLVALRRAGVAVSWEGALAPLALEAERVREPVAGARLLLAAQRGATLALADSAGVLDTVHAQAGGISLETAELVGPAEARDRVMVASAALSADGARRDVLVLGRADWETKFVQAALVESGWPVRARIPTAPGVAVSDAALLPIDTARYDVVVALDSTARDLAPAVARFVVAGGGLVAAGDATTLEAFRTLLPARAGARHPPRILLDADTVTRAELALRALELQRDDAVPLERAPTGLAVAARRARLGRAIAVGYDESWRWRMLGGASGAGAHRRWWSRTVGLAAPSRDDANLTHADDRAPVAALVAALGPPWRAAPSLASSGADALPLVLFVAIAALLLAEIASRRFRGAR